MRYTPRLYFHASKSSLSPELLHLQLQWLIQINARLLQQAHSVVAAWGPSCCVNRHFCSCGADLWGFSLKRLKNMFTMLNYAILTFCCYSLMLWNVFYGVLMVICLTLVDINVCSVKHRKPKCSVCLWHPSRGKVACVVQRLLCAASMKRFFLASCGVWGKGKALKTQIPLE